MNKVCKQFIVNTETLNEGADLRATFDGDLFIYFLIGALRPTQEYFNDMTAPSILVGGNRETGKAGNPRASAGWCRPSTVRQKKKSSVDGFELTATVLVGNYMVDAPR